MGYKKLRKKLKNKFVQSKLEYSILGSIADWLTQCGLKDTEEHINLICEINNNVVPLVYQEGDRVKVLNYLKNNKQFKKL